MNIEDARLYCLSKKNATEDFPFDETTLAFRVENKIFAIVDLDDVSWFCVKCDADYAIELRDSYPQIAPAWHMNKRYWNQMDIEHKRRSSYIEHLLRRGIAENRFEIYYQPIYSTKKKKIIC